jgi:tetratricopeptide (TPR) repeat protein
MHVVVLAYGPSRLTRNSVRRARKLAGSRSRVMTVAASPVAVDAISSLPGTETVTGYGSTALGAALSQLPPEPTLLIHDDVVITTKGVVALERALRAGSRYAVPYSNDPGMDHFIGSLPADKAAEKLLDQMPVPAESKDAEHVRPACVAATAPDLAALLAHPLVDPFTSIKSSQFTFTVAGSALAAHTSACLDQLVADPSATQPLLVAALIVRDEEDMLPDCLASLRPVCDRVEVCDTGSTDWTIDIARSAGATVIEQAWTNDFGAARNRVLEQCRDAVYVLWIDADERLVCPRPEQTRRYLATYATEHPALNLEITNVELDGSELYRFTAVRLFPGTGTEFRGALHEAVHLVGDPRPLDGHLLNQMTIDHHGYAKSVVQGRDKARRNLEIAEAQHEADGDARSAIHLARSLSYAEESPERAIALLEEGLAGADNPATEAQITGLIADRYLQLAENRRAFDLAHRALTLLPGDDTALGVIAEASRRLGNAEELVAIAEELATPRSDRQVLNIEHNRLVFHNQLASAYARLGRAEEAVTQAFSLLEQDPEALSSWPDLISCLSSRFGEAALELILPLALKDTVGGFLEPLIKAYPSRLVADFCAGYVSQGGAVAEATRVGLLAAAMSSNDVAFEAIAPKATELDPFVRVGLADRIAGSGRPDLAEKLSVQPVVLKL